MENKTNFFSLKTAAKKMKTEDPCWKGYKMIGTKKGKGGKDVPNCVPVDSKKSSSEIRTAEKKMKGEDPCWKGYEMIGTKPGKGGKQVPNCVPKKKKSSSIFDIRTAQTFEDWANHELEEEHHQDSMDDGVLTFDEWVNDELSEPDHAAMGQGFSFDDWAREEENEIEHMHEGHDEDEFDDDEYYHDDEYDFEDEYDMEYGNYDDEYDFDDEEEYDDDMMDDWHEECHECEYEKHGDEPMHGECRECDADDMTNDWHDHMKPHMFLISSDRNRIKTAKKKSPAWQRSEGKNKEGGLNEKGRNSYNRETGGNLKAPVTEKKPKGKRKKRRKSFCARMKGMKKKLTSKKTARDPDSRINKALRKWNC
jgi:hypothetical protein